MIIPALLATCLIGRLLPPPSMDACAASKWSFAFAAGAAAISVQMFFYSLAGVGWSRAALLLPWAAAACYVLYRRRPRFSLSVPPAPSWRQWLLGAVVAAPTFVWLPYERVMPMTTRNWDAWAIWLFKAKAFFLDGGIGPFLERSGEFVTQPGYPLLVPLHAAFLYIIQGEVADQAAKLISPCFYWALLGVFYYFARRVGSAGLALSFTAMLAALPAVTLVAFEQAGYADTALAVYLLAAAGFLYEWFRRDRFGDLAAAMLAASAAAWTKNEGQLFLAGVVLLAAARLLSTKAGPRYWAALAAPPALILIPWSLVRRSHGIEAAGFSLLLDFHSDLFATSLKTLLARAFEWQSFNLTFLLLIAAAAAGAWWKVSKAFWVVPGLAAWHLSGALAAYATGRNEIGWWLATSADRILSQVAPLALLAAALAAAHWRDISPDEPASSPQQGAEGRVPKREKRRKGGRRGR